MKEVPLYSLVIFPSQEQMDQIRSYKQLLKDRIGWYNSVDSVAHITIIQFRNDLEFSLFIDQVRDFCKVFSPQNAVFNSWGKFDYSGTFYLAPDPLTKNYLDSLIIDLHGFLNFPIDKTQINAHISIGRKLFNGKLQLAEELFNNTIPNSIFTCDALYVRKFDGRQYSEIIEKISFAS